MTFAPDPPYWAVIFTSQRTSVDSVGYAETAAEMVALASKQPGFLGVEAARGTDGVGITVSYWESLDAIRAWRQHGEHQAAQRLGKEKWYRAYELRVARVERAYALRDGLRSERSSSVSSEQRPGDRINGEETGRASIGHELVGSGPVHVVVLNDWLCDTSTWDEGRKYLDRARFTFAFADLRGYGRTKGRTGAFTVAEGGSDVLALADALGWARFAIVGHSMSALVALHLSQHHVDRIERAVVLAPPPPTGFGADDAMIAASHGTALADEATQWAVLSQRFGARLSTGWTNYKASRWRATADPKAAAAYVTMFARDGLPDPTARIAVPVLAITGEQDAPPMRREAVLRTLGPLCDELAVAPLADCGHYQMQEMPPLTVALVERFLANQKRAQVGTSSQG